MADFHKPFCRSWGFPNEISLFCWTDFRLWCPDSLFLATKEVSPFSQKIDDAFVFAVRRSDSLVSGICHHILVGRAGGRNWVQMGIYGRATEWANHRPLCTPKPRGCKSATIDWTQHVGSSSGLITIVVMTLCILLSCYFPYSFLMEIVFF